MADTSLVVKDDGTSVAAVDIHELDLAVGLAETAVYLSVHFVGAYHYSAVNVTLVALIVALVSQLRCLKDSDLLLMS